jgi:putative endonuclease
MEDKYYYIYILANKNGKVIYIGVTNDLIRRVWEHKEKLVDGFSKKYNVDRLIYYEVFEDAYEAISREKQLKAGPRKKKVKLINSINPNWVDLYAEIASAG